MHLAHLLRLELQRPLILATEQTAPDPIASPARLPLGVEGAEVVQGHIMDPQLLGQLAPGGRLHRLPSGHHATGAGIQHAGAEILARGAPLHQDSTGLIEHQDVTGAMAQIFLTHPGALGHPDHPVLLVYYVHPLHVRHLCPNSDGRSISGPGPGTALLFQRREQDASPP